ncbi:virulence factor family protein [Solimonas soli]|uniref:virulence factor family protein n=1 Tax=Solimonas soli TaxID=413479 RepID=UPI0004BC6118|nr:AcvB/VirJ family lysyl-phosphatidylglycerol hydrolase [Solimonas soli]
MIRVLAVLLCATLSCSAYAGQQAPSKAPARTAAKSARPAAKPREIPLAPGAEQMITHGSFEGVAMYAPRHQVKSFVMLFSDGAWNAQDAEMARQLTERGALVAGIDTARLYAMLDALPDKCLYTSGDVENLSRFVQAYYKVPGYFPPILIGEGTGAALAYLLDAQAGAGKLTGIITLGFCPLTGLKKPFCEGEHVRYASPRARPGLLLPAKDLDAPWTWIDAGVDPASCKVKIDAKFPDIDNGRRIISAAHNREDLFLQSYDTLAAKLAPLAGAALPTSLSDLPLIEIPNSAPGDTFAVLWSGDGGWAGLDKDVAEALKEHGIPVVGVDSLRYFWSEKTPASLAKDMDRVIRYYAHQWKRDKVLLIGYSQGANILPFAMNRMPATTRDMVAVTAMMGLSERADFEFHVSNWVSSSDDGLPIAPEVQKLDGGNPLCVYGTEEDDTLCPSLDPKKVKLVKLPGGHHFDGNYDHLARIILDTAGVTAPK